MESRHPSTHRSRRFLIREYDGEEQVVRLAAAEYWEKVADISAKRIKSEPRRITWEISPGIFLNYLCDRKLRTSYVVVTSRATGDLSQHESRIAASGLNLCTSADLLGEIEEADSPEGKGRALVRAGIGAPLKPDNRYSRLFIESVRDVSPEVRKNGIMAIGYAEWAPFRELLQAVALQDSSAQVRSLAKRMVTAFDEAGVGDS
jgi:hypothetical protein